MGRELTTVWQRLVAPARRVGRATSIHAIAHRIRSARFRQLNLFVVSGSIGTMTPGNAPDIEFRRIADECDPNLDAAIEVDEWGISRTAAIEAMRHNSTCHVARKNDAVIAVTWSTLDTSHFDKESGRTLKLAANETYGWGTHCIPEHRGRRVVPALVHHAFTDLARSHGKTEILGLVLTSNLPMLRAMGRNGYRKVGRMGYLQFGTFRLHYLIGRDAFRSTTRRIFVERVWT